MQISLDEVVLHAAIVLPSSLQDDGESVFSFEGQVIQDFFVHRLVITSFVSVSEKKHFIRIWEGHRTSAVTPQQVRKLD